uniref:M-phase inducer phosphatase n=1 Tax=Caenorhabditis japonica TaxID=281687 RepID=A0A8R1E1V9_CAEJA
MMMMSDDDSTSRDSGICEMDEGAPTCFSSLRTFTAHGSDAMEIDEASTASVLPPPRKKSMRREKSACNVRLFDESPKSGTIFARPVLSVRNINSNSRKRSLDGEVVWHPTKSERRAERASDHYHLESVTELADDDDEFLTNMMEAESATENIPQISAPPQNSIVARPHLFRFHSVAGVTTAFNDEVKDEDSSHLVVKYHLETIATNCSTSYRRITAKTLCEVMNGMSRNAFDEKYVLIDCRYPFEYQGGHIRNAINFYNRDNVAQLFFDDQGNRVINKIPIFYCEFSQKRGPSMAYALRADDRKRNIKIYPRCTYEEMYVLDQGFRNFHKVAASNESNHLVEPNEYEYVEMTDVRFVNQLRQWNFHRRALPGQTVQRTELLRSQSTAAIRPSSSTAKEEEAVRSIPSTSQQSAKSQRSEKNKTPAVPRVASRRNLFATQMNSPTSFDRPGAAETLSSPPPKTEIKPLQNPQWT